MPHRATLLRILTLSGLAAAQASAAEPISKSTYCQYSYYGFQYTQCSTEPVDEAKKACEEQAEKKHGEKLVCWCTDDASYIRDRCD